MEQPACRRSCGGISLPALHTNFDATYSECSFRYGARRGYANSGDTNWAAAGHMFLPLMTLLSWLGNGGGASVSHAN